MGILSPSWTGRVKTLRYREPSLGRHGSQPPNREADSRTGTDVRGKATTAKYLNALVPGMTCWACSGADKYPFALFVGLYTPLNGERIGAHLAGSQENSGEETPTRRNQGGED